MRGWADWSDDQFAAIDEDLLSAYSDYRRTSLEASEWLSSERERVRLVEVWYRDSVRGQVLRLPERLGDPV